MLTLGFNHELAEQADRGLEKQGIFSQMPEKPGPFLHAVH